MWVLFKILRMFRIISAHAYADVKRYRVIEKSPFFDRNWYLKVNPDIAKARVDPVWHYLHRGWLENRNPGPNFDGGYYLAVHKDVCRAKMNPLVHYELYGRRKGRSIKKACGARSPQIAVSSRPKVPSGVPSATRSERTPGNEASEEKLVKKSGYFDKDYYLRYNQDVAAAKCDPLKHFMKRGWREGRNPSSRFDLQYYIEFNREAFASEEEAENPLLHFLKHGKSQGLFAIPAVFPRVMPVADVLSLSRRAAIGKINATGKLIDGKLAVVIHLFYREMLDEFVACLKNMPVEFDVYVTTPAEDESNIADQIVGSVPKCRQCRVLRSENLGRDIGPFSVEVAPFLLHYDYVCKLHTKKDALGLGWRSLILRNLLGSEQVVRTIFNEFAEDPKLGMVYPSPPLRVLRSIAFRGSWADNRAIAERFCKDIGVAFPDCDTFDFPAGSMFWARVEAIRPLLGHKYSYSEFDSSITRDGSLAHAIERLFGLVPAILGFRLADIRVLPPVPVDVPKPYTPLPDDVLLGRVQDYLAKRGKRNRIAVYTAVVNGYDKITLPEELDPAVDYYYFSDRKLLGPSPWRHLPLDYFNVDTTRITRFYKLHPFLYFSTYDYVVWMDANFLLRKNIIKAMKDTLVASGLPFATARHPERNCTYAEAEGCKNSARDDAEVIDQQIERYRAAGFPERFGLCETGVYVVDIRHPDAARVFGDWWSEMEDGSRRDQLSLMPVLWKNKTTFASLFKNYEDTPRFGTRNFMYFLHNGKSSLQYPSVYRYPSFIREEVASVLDTGEYAALYTRNGSRSRRKVTVVVPVHNALADVKNCLASLVPTLNDNVNVVLVNDGSDQECRDFLLDFVSSQSQGFTLIDHVEAKGYTVSINEAVRAAPESDYYVFLNSDTIVPRNWLEKMVDVAETSPSIGVVGPLSNAASWQTVPVLWEDGAFRINVLPEGVDVEEMNRRCELIAPKGVYPKTQLINGFCYMVKKCVFDKIGLFDEESFPTGYCEEDDFSLRMVDAGFVAAIATNTYVFHAKSKSFGSATRQRLVNENQKKFYAKHLRPRVQRECKSLANHPVMNAIRERLVSENERG